MNKIFFFVVSAFSLFSCGNTWNAKSDFPYNYATYYVRLDEENHIVKAEASFDMNNKSHSFDKKILFNGDSMRELPSQNTKKQYTINSNKNAKLIFEIPLKSENKTVEVEMAKLDSFKIKNNNFSLTTGASIFWLEKPLRALESLVLNVEEEGTGKINTITIVGPTKTTGISLGKEQFSQYTLGKATVYPLRKFVTEKTENQIKTLIGTEHYARPVQINIIK